MRFVLLALLAACAAHAEGRPRLAVLAVDGTLPFDARTRIEDALRVTDRFDLQPRADVDHVVAGLAGAGVVCADDSSCLKLAVNAGVEVLVQPLAKDGALTLRYFDTRDSSARVARRAVARPTDIDLTVWALFPVPASTTTTPATPTAATTTSAPATPSPLATRAPTRSITPAKTAHATNAAATAAASAAAAPRSGASLWVAGAFGGLGAVAALGCGIAAAGFEAQASDLVTSWKRGATVDKDTLQGIESAETSLAACAVVAGVVGASGVAIALALGD